MMVKSTVFPRAALGSEGTLVDAAPLRCYLVDDQSLVPTKLDVFDADRAFVTTAGAPAVVEMGEQRRSLRGCSRRCGPRVRSDFAEARARYCRT